MFKIYSGLLLKGIFLFNLSQNLTKEMADYCASRMKPYHDPKTEQPIPGAYDYIDFTRTLFSN